MKLLKYLCLGCLLFGAQSSMAVDMAKVTARFFVVGAISGAGTNKGVAILKDAETEKSITVAVGGSLGNNKDLSVKRIMNKKVVVTDGEHDVTLAYRVVKRDEEEATDDSTVELDEEDVKDYLTNLDEVYVNSIFDEWEDKIAQKKSSTSKHKLIRDVSRLENFRSLKRKNDDLEVDYDNFVNEDEGDAGLDFDSEEDYGY